MTESNATEILDPDLTGIRVGLSGAIPEPSEWDGRALDWDILNAVTTLADTVLRAGGHLVHGSHPSFTPRVLAQAEPYAAERREPVVTFVLSALFGNTPLAKQLRDPRYQRVLKLIVVDAVIPPSHEGHGAENSAVRNASLRAMRERLIAEMDALVLIGGKRWAGSANKPGTLEELEIARSQGIPTYLLGGLGGMAAELASSRELREHANAIRVVGPAVDDLERSLVHPLSVARTEEDFIRTTTDYGRAISLISRKMSTSLPHRTKGHL